MIPVVRDKNLYAAPSSGPSRLAAAAYEPRTINVKNADRTA